MAPPGLPSTLCTMLDALSRLQMRLCFDETSHQKYTNAGLKNPAEGFLASKGQFGLILATVHVYDRAKL